MRIRWSSDVCSSDLLRRGRLRLEPDHAVVLFLELEEIIDREIERRPGRERGRVDIYRTEQKTGEARLARRVLDLRDPRVDEGPERGRDAGEAEADPPHERSEEHTSELQSLMRISYAVFCLKKKKKDKNTPHPSSHTQKS